DHHRSRTSAMSCFIQLFQKRDGFEVFASTKLIWRPLPFLAAVVEIKHRSDRIDAQSIDVKLLEPVERVCDEEIANLVATVVEDVSAPTRMFAFARIEVFVQSGAIESTERPRILRKMRRHPIHDHADAAAMKVVD